jgi:hypothetical protein
MLEENKDTVLEEDNAPAEAHFNVVKEKETAEVDGEIVARKVTIKPVKSYKKGGMMTNVSVFPGAKVTLAPYKDSYNQFVTGHTLEECKAYKFAEVNDEFWRKYKFVLTDTVYILDLGKEQDMLRYKFCKGHYQVANSPEEVNHQTKFVMFDEEAEAEKRSAEVQKKVRALAMLNEMSQVQQAKFLKLFGYKTRSMSPTVIFSKLAEIAETPTRTPGKGAAYCVDDFIRMYEDKDKATRILIKSLEQAEIINKENMSYKYGEDLLGTTFDQTLMWFKDSKNQEIVTGLINQLEIKEKV